MAKRLEDSLYRAAPSLEDYMDQNTLKKRLQTLAMNMGSNRPVNTNLSSSENALLKKEVPPKVTDAKPGNMKLYK